MSATRLMWDALADAEAEVAKLRRLLVTKLCDCRTDKRLAPLEPHEHRLTCTYRRSLS